MNDKVTIQPNALRSIVIVGGGTAGWMAAAKLARHLERQPVSITVVESSDIGTVGVGEATVPAIRDFFREIGLQDYDVMKASQATVKLGIQFEDWLRPGHDFFHPFGLYGSPSRHVPFHQYWLKLREAGDTTPLADYSLCSVMAKRGVFRPPSTAPNGDLSVFNWALHFDAGLYARVLRDFAIGMGVQRIDAKIMDTHLRSGDGFITSVELDDGRHVEGDFFIDCSGFRALLINGALGVDYVDWRDLLPCDRAVAMPCALTGEQSIFTRSKARAAGWQWRIPLQHRLGNGYVYASRFISDDEALADLTSQLEGEALGEPNFIRFVTGHREKFWSKNCVALGLAGGFLEPLESTSITLIQTGLEKLVSLFPDRDCNPVLADEFNRVATLEYERIRDFILLHYIASQRDEAMWKWCREVSLPQPLQHKIAVFKESGKLLRYEWETFFDPSWLSMFAGFELLPRRHDPMADYFTNDELQASFMRMRKALADAAATAMPHSHFIYKYCKTDR